MELFSSLILFSLMSCFHWQWEFNAKPKCHYGFQQRADGWCNFAVSLSVKSKTDKWGRTRTLLYRSHTSASVHYLLIGDRCGFMFPLDVHPNICESTSVNTDFFPLSDQFRFFFHIWHLCHVNQEKDLFSSVSGLDLSESCEPGLNLLYILHRSHKHDIMLQLDDWRMFVLLRHLRGNLREFTYIHTQTQVQVSVFFFCGWQ